MITGSSISSRYFCHLAKHPLGRPARNCVTVSLQRYSRGPPWRPLPAPDRLRSSASLFPLAVAFPPRRGVSPSSRRFPLAAEFPPCRGVSPSPRSFPLAAASPPRRGVSPSPWRFPLTVAFPPRRGVYPSPWGSILAAAFPSSCSPPSPSLPSAVCAASLFRNGTWRCSSVPWPWSFVARLCPLERHYRCLCCPFSPRPRLNDANLCLLLGLPSGRQSSCALLSPVDLPPCLRARCSMLSIDNCAAVYGRAGFIKQEKQSIPPCPTVLPA